MTRVALALRAVGCVSAPLTAAIAPIKDGFADSTNGILVHVFVYTDCLR